MDSMTAALLALAGAVTPMPMATGPSTAVREVRVAPVGADPATNPPAVVQSTPMTVVPNILMQPALNMQLAEAVRPEPFTDNPRD